MSKIKYTMNLPNWLITIHLQRRSPRKLDTTIRPNSDLQTYTHTHTLSLCLSHSLSLKSKVKWGTRNGEWEIQKLVSDATNTTHTTEAEDVMKQGKKAFVEVNECMKMRNFQMQSTWLTQLENEDVVKQCNKLLWR